MSGLLDRLSAERQRRRRRAVAKHRRSIGADGGAPAAFLFQGNGGLFGAATSGAVLLNWPTQLTNDIGLMFIETANQPIATPSGWNAIANASQGVGTAGSVTATCLQVFWRRAASAAESAVTILGAANTGDHIIGVIIGVRGCVASGDPIDVSAGDTTADADATAVSIPGATTTVANCYVVAACARQTDIATLQQSGETNADLASLNERFDSGSTAGNGGGLAIITGLKATAGLYGATTATLTSASRQGRVSFALKGP
jgi:hypothetical protein